MSEIIIIQKFGNQTYASYNTATARSSATVQTDKYASFESAATAALTRAMRAPNDFLPAEQDKPTPAEPEPPNTTFDWDAFKTDKIAVHCDTEEKAIAFLKEAKAHGLKWVSGDDLEKYSLWSHYKENTCYTNNVSYCDKGHYISIGYTIIDYPFAPAEQPKPAPDKSEPTPAPEPILFYCINDYASGVFMTQGKVYEYKDGRFTWDDGIAGGKYDSYTEFVRKNPDLAACLFPLVSRPAKVGEWVYINKPCAHEHTGWVAPAEYLILDGYTPEPCKHCGK